MVVDGNPGRVPIPSRALAPAGKARLRQRVLMGTLGGFPCPRHRERVCGAEADHFVSLCSVCFRHRLQYFDNFSFSALARLFLVVE
jgi:hypothetical protein